MDWVSATYNKLETFAVAADRVVGAVVERCEEWLAGSGRAGGSGEIAGQTPVPGPRVGDGAGPGEPRSA